MRTLCNPAVRRARQRYRTLVEALGPRRSVRAHTIKKEKRKRGKINDCKANANAQLAVEIKLCLDDSLTRETVASLYFRRLTAAEELPAEPH